MFNITKVMMVSPLITSARVVDLPNDEVGIELSIKTTPGQVIHADYYRHMVLLLGPKAAELLADEITHCAHEKVITRSFKLK